MPTLLERMGGKDRELLVSHLYYLPKISPKFQYNSPWSHHCLNVCLLLCSILPFFDSYVCGKTQCVEDESDFSSISYIRSLWYHNYLSELRVLSFLWWGLRDTLRFLRFKYVAVIMFRTLKNVAIQFQDNVLKIYFIIKCVYICVVLCTHDYSCPCWPGTLDLWRWSWKRLIIHFLTCVIRTELMSRTISVITLNYYSLWRSLHFLYWEKNLLCMKNGIEIIYFNIKTVLCYYVTVFM